MTRAGLLPLLLPVLLAAACGGPEPGHLEGQAMGTYFTVDYAGGGVRLAEVARRVREALDEWDLLFNTYRQDSEISRFNAHRSTEPFPASPTFSLLLFEALEMAEKTGGAFDPTIAPLLRLYGFGPGATKPDRLPSDAELEAAKRVCGYRNVERLAGRGVRKRIQDLELDLNAIAKGAGVDRLAAVLEADLGIENFMINIGGEICCRGEHPEGRPWCLGVEMPATGPDEEQEPAATVKLVNEAMATSGSYRQFRSFEGQDIHHILDPRTGRNARTDVVSVSVVASSCSVADGLATALMVVGPEGCEEILRRYPGSGLRVLFLLRGKDGAVKQEGFGWRY